LEVKRKRQCSAEAPQSFEKEGSTARPKKSRSRFVRPRKLDIVCLFQPLSALPVHGTLTDPSFAGFAGLQPNRAAPRDKICGALQNQPSGRIFINDRFCNTTFPPFQKSLARF
jgi:hypothetical protein